MNGSRVHHVDVCAHMQGMNKNQYRTSPVLTAPAYVAGWMLGSVVKFVATRYERRTQRDKTEAVRGSNGRVRVESYSQPRSAT